MKSNFFVWVFCFMLVLLYQEGLEAYSSAVHTQITARVIDLNTSKLDGYFKDVGFANGIREYINNKPVRWWIEEGSVSEDTAMPIVALPTSHYHNPYTNKGFSVGGITGESAYDRANNPVNLWSWKNARDILYKGLTSTTRFEREIFLAHSFKALGHLMHLIQDMSVPAHTRDDMHVPYVDGEPYEVYTHNNRRILNYASDPFLYWNVSISPVSPNAPKQFWDLDSYTGAIAYDSGYIGLSEYTHANFLSKDTIFKYFPHPDPAPPNTNYYDFGLLPYTVIARPGNINHNTLYITGYGKKHLAALKYFAGELWELPIPLPRVYQLTLHLDNECHKEYAHYLIPRAVGYSAGLLDYFFRGKLRVTAIPIFYKSGIQYLRVRVKNMTPNETMKDGEFTVTYSYRPSWGKADGSDDVWGQSPLVPSGKLLYDGEEKVIDFWLPNPIPKENYDSAKFTLAFKGTLGNEEGAVIGKALTLGEIKFSEEWDNGLNGNYTWAHTDFNLFDQNPANGNTSNVIEADTLIKDNTRYVGHKIARVNESFLDYEYNNGQFRDSLPIPITPDTYLQFKIDAMWINEIPPAPSGYTNHWQALIMHFNNGLSLQYFQEGQGLYTGSNTAYLTFPLGVVVVDNIYEMFKGAGITVSEPLYLESIDFLQQLFQLDQPSTVQHHQHMEIDGIRIIEGKQQ
jgi:hypothetical protein